MDHDLVFSYSFENWVHDEEISIPSLIIAAFTWDETEMQPAAWFRLHHFWENYCEEMY